MSVSKQVYLYFVNALIRSICFDKSNMLKEQPITYEQV